AWNASGDAMNPGVLDEVAVWRSVLTPTEIQGQYASGTAGTAQAYVYQAYDPDGNETQVSLATTATTLAAVASSDLTTTQYLDTGSIYSTLDGSTGLATRFDYSPTGWQTARYPDTTGTPNTVDYTRAMYWD